MFEHGEAAKAYGPMDDMKMYAIPDDGRIGGRYSASKNEIGVAGGRKEDVMKSDILHELQHAIQQREDFARGGSPEMFEQEAAKYRQDMTRLELGGWPANNQVAEWWKKELGQDLPEWALQDARQMTREELEKIVNEYYSTFKALPNNVDTHAAYQRLAGEAESRAVQDRMNMNMDQRRASFPEYATRDDLIVRGGGLMSGGR